MGRWQPPVHSPLSAGALAAGAAALLGGRTDEADLIDRLRQAHGSKDALRTDSGTTALTLALRHLGREHPSRPVALPAYCCFDIATAADGAGVPVALYDI